MPEIFSGLLCAYLHPLSGADVVSRLSWQLVAAICEEGDCLTLSNSHNVMTTILILLCYLQSVVVEFSLQSPINMIGKALTKG